MFCQYTFVIEGALFVSVMFRCFWFEYLSFSFVKEREGILYLFPSFSFTPETAEYAGHEQSALSNTKYSGGPFGSMLEVRYICGEKPIPDLLK